MNEELYFASDVIDGIKIDLIASINGVREILINKRPGFDKLSEINQITPDDPKVLNTLSQLREYFNRQRKEFDLQLEILGTDFQKKVWDELIKIPYGETIIKADDKIYVAATENKLEDIFNKAGL